MHAWAVAEEAGGSPEPHTGHVPEDSGNLVA